MIALPGVWKRPDSLQEVDDYSLRYFAERAFLHMAMNNQQGQYDNHRDRLLDAYTSYYGPPVSRITRLAIHRSFFYTLENAIRLFKTLVSRQEPMLREFLGYGSIAYETFFPYGPDEYRHAGYSNAEWLMNRFANSAQQQSREVGPSFAKLFRKLASYYSLTRTRQSVFQSLNEHSMGVLVNDRNPLEQQVISVMRQLAWDLRTRPRRVHDYFNHTLVRPSKEIQRDLQGNVFAHVRDAATHLPIRGVAMQVLNTDLESTETDDLGRARSETMIIGRYQIQFSKPGYCSLSRKVRVHDAGDTLVEVVMEREWDQPFTAEQSDSDKE